MSEAAGVEEQGEDITVEFVGHPQSEIVIVQKGLGLNPGFYVDVIIDDDLEQVAFKVSTYGTDAHKEFLETIRSVIDTVLERFPEDTNAESDPEQG